MDLLEHQAKELFEQVGIPTLPSQTIHDASELKRLHIPYPVVLKSQVRTGGRGKAGGIRFVENTIDAIAAARSIFALPIMGEYPQAILAEARYDAQAEFFLAVLLDYQLQCPVLLGSAKGGMDVESLLQHMQTVVLAEEFSPFYARRLVINMGLRGELVQSVSRIIEKMYHLFWEKDLDIIEINPLGVSATGEVMALDGKITANDHALLRHPELVSLVREKPAAGELETLPQWLNGDEKRGTVAALSNSGSLLSVTWDAIAQEKGKLAGSFLLEADYPHHHLSRQIRLALEQLGEISSLKVVLAVASGSPDLCQAFAEAIADCLEPQVRPLPKQQSEDRTIRATGAIAARQDKISPSQSRTSVLPLVVYLASGDLPSLEERFSGLPVYWAESLEAAVSQTLALGKGK